MIGSAGRRKKPFDVQPPFASLKVFDLHGMSNRRGTNYVASLLKFPAIQEILIFGCFRTTWIEVPGAYRVEEKSLTESDSRSSRVTSLELAAYELGMADLSESVSHASSP